MNASGWIYITKQWNQLSICKLYRVHAIVGPFVVSQAALQVYKARKGASANERPLETWGLI